MRLILALFVVLAAWPAAPGETIRARPGWAIHQSPLSYDELRARLPSAIKAAGMGKVTEAGPTGVAANRGIEIPGSRVFGVFNNDFAVRTIRLSLSAMIEAPIRIYVTESPDGTSTLSYKIPSHVFAPYMEEGGAELNAIAVELDVIFAQIAATALAP
ncbi:MAG: DUF302 domain-containing protein [Pseudomonadota bacterium]